MSGEHDPREGFAAFLLRLRQRGIVSKNLVAAFEATPRHAFVPERWQGVAWSDRMIPIECGEAIEGADLQAAILTHMAIEPGHRVLEIGTGSGYTAAVMSRLASRIITLERYKTLVGMAAQRFEGLSITNASVRQTDGMQGLAAEGPYDRIIVWAAFEELPRQFIDQLSTGGMMITPVGPEEDEQSLIKLTKIGSRFEREEIGTVRLQMLQRGVAEII